MTQLSCSPFTEWRVCNPQSQPDSNSHCGLQKPLSIRGINVVESTENSRLDGRAIAALKLWEAKPRSIHTVRVPINFLVKEW